MIWLIIDTTVLLLAFTGLFCAWKDLRYKVNVEAIIFATRPLHLTKDVENEVARSKRWLRRANACFAVAMVLSILSLYWQVHAAGSGSPVKEFILAQLFDGKRVW